MPEDIDQLFERVERIRVILGAETARARKMPNDARKVYESLVLRPAYDGSAADAAAAAAQAAVDRAKAAAIKKAHQARRGRLRALAGELEALRAILPQIAAKAAVAIGIEARALEAEADE